MAVIDIDSSIVAAAIAAAALSVSPALNGSVVVRAVSDASMETRGQALQTLVVAGASASGTLTIRNQRMDARVTARAISDASLSARRYLRAAVTVRARVLGAAGVDIVLHSAAGVKAVATARACLDAGRDGLGVCDVVSELLLLWGMENHKVAPGYAKRRALHDLNSAMQQVWNQARDRDYWTRSTLTVTLGAGESSQTLPNQVQNVVGPARLENSRRTLAPAATVGEIERFADLYFDGVNPSEPVAYHIERQNQTGNDPAKCTLHVVPAPEAETNFLLDVVNEAPRFGQLDFDACTRIPMPHRYVESLLLPIARFRAMSFYLFDAKDRAEAITAEYQIALAALDAADPAPVEKREEGRA